MCIHTCTYILKPINMYYLSIYLDYPINLLFGLLFESFLAAMALLFQLKNNWN